MIKAIVLVAIVIAVTYVTLGAGTVGTLGYFGAIGAASGAELVTIGLISGFATGAVGALMEGATIGQALIAGATGALIGGLTAGLTHGIASNLGHTGNYLRRAIAHGTVSGVMNKARGGNFGNGFMSTFFSTLAGGVKVGTQWAQGVFQTMVGGTASAIGGGKFANGAVSSAMVYLFNDVAKKSENALSLLDKWAKGKGGEYYFGSEHPMTLDMQYSPKLQNAINQWIFENHNIGDAGRLSVSFFPIQEGMFNLTRQFVGSFSASIYQIDTNRVGVYLFNNTSIKSAMYHIGLPNNYGQNYMLRQHYYFEETY